MFLISTNIMLYYITDATASRDTLCCRIAGFC